MSDLAMLAESPSRLPRINGDRAVVEQAKGALMLRYGISSHEAFALLLTWARHSNTTLRTIAHALVKGVLHSGEADPDESALVRWLQEQLNEEIPGQRLHP